MKYIQLIAVILLSLLVWNIHETKSLVEIEKDEEVDRKALIQPGNILAYREVVLKDGVDYTEFEHFAANKLTPEFERYVPGVRALVLKGNRGDRVNGYSIVLLFDSVNTRDFYFAREGEPSNTELWSPGQEMIEELLDEYVDEIGETEGYTDYLILGSGTF